jgi:tetratricopeptide (TPR) repeat protein
LAKHQEGQVKKALEWFELASELDPEHTPTLYQIGLMHMKLKNMKEALAALNRVSNSSCVHSFPFFH